MIKIIIRGEKNYLSKINDSVFLVSLLSFYTTGCANYTEPKQVQDADNNESGAMVENMASDSSFNTSWADFRTIHSIWTLHNH